MNPNGPNFDFIMNSPKQKSGRLAMDSKKKRIMVVGIGAVTVLIVVLVLKAIIGNVGGKSNNQVLDLAAYQYELKRVISLGNERARSSGTKNKALTASYTLESDYKLTVKIVNSRGIKPPKELTARYAGSQNDQALDAAEKANNFDTKYEEIYKEKLTNYKTKLAEIYPSLTPAEQALIKKQNDHAKLLLGEQIAAAEK
jgi:hypothetical protein